MPKVKLTPQAKTVVQKAIDNILAHPEQFEMSDWFTKTNLCGTAGCLAGHIAVAAGFPRKNIQTAVKYQKWPQVSGRTANKLLANLGLPKRWGTDDTPYLEYFVSDIIGNPANLYSVYDWPEPFHSQYLQLEAEAGSIHDLDPKDKKAMKLRTKMAKLSVRRLKHYLRTGE